MQFKYQKQFYFKQLVDLGARAIIEYSTFPKDIALDCLVSYAGHSLGESYTSVEMQSVFSTALVNWVNETVCFYSTTIQISLV